MKINLLIFVMDILLMTAYLFLFIKNVIHKALEDSL